MAGCSDWTLHIVWTIVNTGFENGWWWWYGRRREDVEKVVFSLIFSRFICPGLCEMFLWAGVSARLHGPHGRGETASPPGVRGGCPRWQRWVRGWARWSWLHWSPGGRPDCLGGAGRTAATVPAASKQEKNVFRPVLRSRSRYFGWSEPRAVFKKPNMIQKRLFINRKKISELKTIRNIF